jgi:hypothetical protein
VRITVIAAAAAAFFLVAVLAVSAEPYYQCRESCGLKFGDEEKACVQALPKKTGVEYVVGQNGCSAARQQKESACNVSCDDRHKAALSSKCPNGPASVRRLIDDEKEKCGRLGKEDDKSACRYDAEQKYMPNYRACNGEL